MVEEGRDGVVELVRRVQRGDSSAMDELAVASTLLAFRLVGAWSGRSEDAEDIVQEVVRDVFLYVHRLKSPERFLGWLDRIAKRRTMDFLRRKYREGKLGTLLNESDLDGLPDGRSTSGLFEILEREKREALEREIAGLPPIYAQVLLLALRDELGTVEIAEALGLPEATVRTRYHRGVKRLKKRMRGRP